MITPYPTVNPLLTLLIQEGSLHLFCLVFFFNRLDERNGGIASDNEQNQHGQQPGDPQAFQILSVQLISSRVGSPCCDHSVLFPHLPELPRHKVSLDGPVFERQVEVHDVFSTRLQIDQGADGSDPATD